MPKTISTTKTVISPSVELEPVRDVLDPITGELVPISDRAAVAEVIDRINEARGKLTTAMREIADALQEEAQVAGLRTFSAEGGVKLVLTADSELEWDHEALFKLTKLGLPEERMKELVTEEVTYKVNGTVARQLSASNPKYKKVIETAKRRKPKNPSVKVQRPTR